LAPFRCRSRVVIGHEPGWSIDGRFGAPESARVAAFAGTRPDTALEQDLDGEGGALTLRVNAPGAGGDPALAARWRQQDLAHGLPRLEAAQAGQWTPQQLSLERLRAYSVHKGCYPGQEIVARTHFLGQAKRGLVRRGGDAALATGPVA